MAYKIKTMEELIEYLLESLEYESDRRGAAHMSAIDPTEEEKATIPEFLRHYRYGVVQGRFHQLKELLELMDVIEEEPSTDYSKILAEVSEKAGVTA